MCDSLPSTEDPPENYYVDNVQKSVGQIVTVFCKNVTVAVIQCMPDLKWNATVPGCSAVKPHDTMATLLIIVWAVGAVLLVALIVLIVMIVSYRSKNNCRSRGNSSPASSVFHVSGGRREGGDNLAFSRADERCGEWSFHRAADVRDSARLPSYQEAILNNYITAADGLPERTNFVRADAPPSYRSSQHQSVAPDSGTVTSTHSPDPQLSTVDEINSRPSTETLPANQEPQQAPSSSNQRNAPVSSRYAENYPQCFFQEEPPPPYTPGPTNYNNYRSPVRRSLPRSGGLSRRGASQTYTSQNNSIRTSNVRRSTQERCTATQRQNEMPAQQVNQINHEPLHSIQNISPLAHESVSSQSDSGYSQSQMTNLLPSSFSASHSSHNQRCLNQSNGLTSPRSSVPQSDNSNCIPGVTEGSDRLAESIKEPSQQDTLYIVRNCRAAPTATPTAPHYPSSSQHFQLDVQPIGTSTPLTQSPFVVRRFFPDNHPPQQPTSNIHQLLPTSQPHPSVPQQEPYIFYTGTRSQNLCQSQTALTDGLMFSQYSTHYREGTAPIVRSFDHETLDRHNENHI